MRSASGSTTTRRRPARPFAIAASPSCSRPNFHPAMKHAGPTRREIGVRTAFNLLGPLTNPAGTRRQLLGVGDAAVAARMAEVVQRLGTERTFVIHGDGVDELPLDGSGVAYIVAGDVVERHVIDAAALGFKRAATARLSGGTPEENARMTEAVLRGEPGGAPRRRAAQRGGRAARRRCRRADGGGHRAGGADHRCGPCDRAARGAPRGPADGRAPLRPRRRPPPTPRPSGHRHDRRRSTDPEPDGARQRRRGDRRAPPRRHPGRGAPPARARSSRLPGRRPRRGRSPSASPRPAST